MGIFNFGNDGNLGLGRGSIVDGTVLGDDVGLSLKRVGVVFIFNFVLKSCGSFNLGKGGFVVIFSLS